MSCLSTLWTRESGWRYWVSNPNGIYRGIPQTSSRVWGAMGYSTSQYMNSPAIQIKVGAKYIKSRYGSPATPGRSGARTTGTDRRPWAGVSRPEGPPGSR